jgi:hypothetical protein
MQLLGRFARRPRSEGLTVCQRSGIAAKSTLMIIGNHP